MNTAIIHTVSGPHPRSHSVTAPGWVPAAAVAEATGLLPRSPAAAACSWSDWVSAHPVSVDARGLPLLTPLDPTPDGHARLVVRAGPESGFAIALPQGEWTLGRGEGVDVDLADPYLSRRPLPLSNGPAGIRVAGTSLGTTGGPRRAGTPQQDRGARCIVGSTTIELTGTGSPTTADGITLSHPTHDDEPLVWPEPQAVAPVRSPSWIVYVAPIVIGIALALIVGTWWFLLLSLAGPATASLTLRAERGRHLRESARARRSHRTEIARTIDELADRLSAYVHRLDADAYSAAVPRSVQPDRPGLVVLGTGRVISTVAIRLPRDRHPRSRARRRLPAHHVEGDLAFLIAEDAPILIDRRLPVRVTGPEARAGSIVRSLVADHLAEGNGCRSDAGFPEFAGLADSAAVCVVARNEPTTSMDSSSLASYTVSGPRAVEDALIDIRCGGPDRPDEIHVPDPHTLDQALTGVAQAAPRTGTRRHGPPLTGQAQVHALSRKTFLRLLATIGPRAGEAGGAPPPAAAVPTTSVSDVLRQWDVTGRPDSGPLAAPIGLPVARPEPPEDARQRSHTVGTPPGRPVAAAPFLTLDLRAAGPHALVAGTTGSGKSVLLEAWLEALCRAHSAEELRLVLLDFKGGASLSRFLSRPHTDCVVTDLDEAAALRAVRSITAEITRRERHLAEAGCRDLDDLLARSQHDSAVTPLPRLLVVIDEFHVLTSLSPHIVTEFELLTAVGRSLGVHIVLATQRPSGVVSARMRANISLRICLRVRDEADSHEVLGIPDAAWIDARLPGTALVSDDAGVRTVRCAVPDDPLRARTRPPQVTVTSLIDASEAVLPLRCEVAAPPAPAAGPPGPRHTVIAPPLPTRIPTAGVGSSGSDGSSVVRSPGTDRSPAVLGSDADSDRSFVGLIDLPDENRVAPALIVPGSGSITVSGGRGHGWSTAVNALAVAFHAAGLPVIHLGPHAGLPSVGADGVLRLGHAQAWMIDHLVGICETRRVPVVWAVDDWDEFVQEHQSSPRIDRLERLLTGSAGMRFVVSGHRRLLAQRLSQTATTRIVFPPAADADAVFFGLNASRFTGEWPPGRAVILGQGSLTDGREGADLQIVQRPAGSAAEEAGAPPHPLWNGFQAPADPVEADPPQPHRSTRGILIGLDPAGDAVTWHPADDGSVLSVLTDDSSPTRDSSEPTVLARFAEDLRARDVAVVLDPADQGQRVSADAAAAAGRPVCLMPGAPPDAGHARSTLLSTPGAGRLPLHPASSEPPGPLLLFGPWQEPALRAAGFRGCAPIPREADASWWICGDTATPVRLLSRDAPRHELPGFSDQKPLTIPLSTARVKEQGSL